MKKTNRRELNMHLIWIDRDVYVFGPHMISNNNYTVHKFSMAFWLRFDWHYAKRSLISAPNIRTIDRARAVALISTHTHTHLPHMIIITQCANYYLSQIARLFIRFVSFTHPFPVCYVRERVRTLINLYWLATDQCARWR